MSEVLEKLDTSRIWQEDQDMSESARQHTLNGYLEAVLRWLYRKEGWFVGGDLPMQSQNMSDPVSPDISLLKNVVLSEEEIDDLTVWQIALPHRPPPAVVFEVASKSTWRTDVNDKPAVYHKMGVKEYFTFDPNQIWGKRKQFRLKGWRYTENSIIEIPVQNDQLWSEELQTWLVPQGRYLRLFDTYGNLLLTRDEANELEMYQLQVTAELEKQAAQETKTEIIRKLRERGIDPSDLGL